MMSLRYPLFTLCQIYVESTTIVEDLSLYRQYLFRTNKFAVMVNCIGFVTENFSMVMFGILANCAFTIFQRILKCRFAKFAASEF